MSWRASRLIGTTVALAGVLAAPLPAGVVGVKLNLALLTRGPIDFASNALEVDIEP
ncbi:MAG: hypothetical protein V2A76_12745 [Planctomycetota bacterium]